MIFLLVGEIHSPGQLSCFSWKNGWEDIDARRFLSYGGGGGGGGEGGIGCYVSFFLRGNFLGAIFFNGCQFPQNIINRTSKTSEAPPFSLPPLLPSKNIALQNHPFSLCSHGNLLVARSIGRVGDETIKRRCCYLPEVK